MVMTNRVQFSELQLINLSTLLAIRDGIKRDPVSTCCQFGIAADAASFFSELSTDRIIVIVANFGNECLFPPRPDLISLLRLPVSLTESVAAVHPLRKATLSSVPACTKDTALN
jgi:hypothetical protein